MPRPSRTPASFSLFPYTWHMPHPSYPPRFIIIIIIIIIYLSWSWATCWPIPVSRIQKSLQRSAMIPSASRGIVFHFPG
jgi:hypothetical protein